MKCVDDTQCVIPSSIVNHLPPVILLVVQYGGHHCTGHRTRPVADTPKWASLVVDEGELVGQVRPSGRGALRFHQLQNCTNIGASCRYVCTRALHCMGSHTNFRSLKRNPLDAIAKVCSHSIVVTSLACSTSLLRNLCEGARGT